MLEMAGCETPSAVFNPDGGWRNKKSDEIICGVFLTVVGADSRRRRSF
jgi:uncharacterized lipoprotein YajG